MGEEGVHNSDSKGKSPQPRIFTKQAYKLPTDSVRYNNILASQTTKNQNVKK